jgi:hypothetical protein
VIPRAKGAEKKLVLDAEHDSSEGLYGLQVVWYDVVEALVVVAPGDACEPLLYI